MVKIAVLVSGGGTNLQALIDARESGVLGCGELCAVISSRPGAYALTRAENAGIPTFVIDVKQYPDREDFSGAILNKLIEAGADLVIFAGFMYVLGGKLVKRFENRMINVHCSLIPSFCGDGCFGLGVHKRVLEYGVKVTGATVHFITEETDGGPIILQKAVDVLAGDTPEILQKRVMEQAEWPLIAEAVRLFCQNRLRVNGRHVEILP